MTRAAPHFRPALELWACSYSPTLVPPIAALDAPEQDHLKNRIAHKGPNMASEAEWLDDVRRWYFGGTPPETDDPATESGNDDDVGYEAAHPALVAHHWPDAPSGIADPAPSAGG
ncbi:MAG: hypothetical protein ABIO45_12360 [Burkholderiaceae bacterium]